VERGAIKALIPNTRTKLVKTEVIPSDLGVLEVNIGCGVRIRKILTLTEAQRLEERELKG